MGCRIIEKYTRGRNESRMTSMAVNQCRLESLGSLTMTHLLNSITLVLVIHFIINVFVPVHLHSDSDSNVG